MATLPDTAADQPPRPHVPARAVLLSASVLWLIKANSPNCYGDARWSRWRAF